MSNLDSQISTTPQLPSSGPDKAGGGLTKGGSSEGDIGGSSYVPACTRLTVAEVARHNNREDCWVIINGEVLDVTGFLPDHPGGEKSILNFAGRDASKMFNMIHSPDVIQRYLSAEAVLGPVVEEVPVDEVSSEVPQSPRAADSSRGGTLPMHEPSQQCMEEPESPQAVGSATSTTHHGCSVQSVGSEESDLAVEGQEYWVILGGEVHDITSALPQLLQGTDASILEYGGMHLDEAIDCPPVSRMLVELADGSEVTVVDFLPEGSVGAQRHIPAAEVAKHCSEDDCWIIVNGKVIDVTTFLPDHPGGKSPILSVAGQDASDKYNLVHPPDFIQKYVPSLVLGDLADDDAKAPAPEVASAPGGYLLAFCYLVEIFVKEALRSIFTVENYKVLSDRSGLTRSAVFLMAFVTIHALGNIHLFFGPDHFNGYAYFLNQPIPLIGTLARPIEIYLLMAGLMHVVVATSRIVKFKKENLSVKETAMATSGLVLLVFLLVHLRQFRLAPGAEFATFPLRPRLLPPFYCSPDDDRCAVVLFRDIYRRVFDIFSSPFWVLFYTIGSLACLLHMHEGLRRVIRSSEDVPYKYNTIVQIWGSVMAWVVGLLFLSFPLYCYYHTI